MKTNDLYRVIFTKPKWGEPRRWIDILKDKKMKVFNHEHKFNKLNMKFKSQAIIPSIMFYWKHRELCDCWWVLGNGRDGYLPFQEHWSNVLNKWTYLVRWLGQNGAILREKPEVDEGWTNAIQTMVLGNVASSNVDAASKDITYGPGLKVAFYGTTITNLINRFTQGVITDEIPN